MATIVTRSGKGSPLTHNEVDSNFTNLNTDKLELSGGTMTGNLSFGDNDKAIFGAGSDLTIFSDGGTFSYINNTQGILRIRNTSDDQDVVIQSDNGSGGVTDYFTADGSTGAAILHNYGATKLATTSTGISVTGNATFADNGKAIFGAGSDLQIYHSGSNSHITEGGTGNLIIRADDFRVQSNAGEEYIAADANGAVSLRYDNATKLATTSTGIDVTGTVTADDVSIADTSPTLLFNRTDRATDNKIIRFAHDGEDFQIQLANDAVSSVTPAIAINRTGMSLDSIAFYEDTGTTAKFFWDASAESLGIGTTSPSFSIGQGLHIDSGGYTAINLQKGTSGGGGHIIDFTDASNTIQYRIGTNFSSGGENLLFAYGSTPTVGMTLNSSGNVGIGTSSPATSVSGSAQGLAIEHSNVPFLSFDNTGSSGKRHTIYGNTAGSLVIYDEDAASTRMVIDSSGNVGIGTSSPTAVAANYTTLHLDGSSGSGIHLTKTTSGTTATDGSHLFNAGGDFYLYHYESGNIIISSGATPTERMRIDSSGNVGIGAASPSSTFRTSIYGDGSSIIGGVEFRNAASGGSTFTIGHASATSPSATLNVTDAANLIFKTDDTEAMRIDSSGNLLVNHTSISDWTTTVGAQVRGTGYVIGTVDGDYPFIANRLTSDGDIMQFRKDGTTVGSIGSIGGTQISMFGSGGKGVQLGGAGHLSPADTSGNLDATINLGSDVARFKDLYLSGDIEAGGQVYVNRDNTDWSFLSNQTGSSSFAHMLFRANGTLVGSISSTASATSYNTSSDYRLKENVVELTGATDRLKQLEPKRFNFIADADTTVDGFLAHEVQSVVPEAITGTHNEVDDDGNPVYQGIDQSKLVPLLVATIKELEARITALENG